MAEIIDCTKCAFYNNGKCDNPNGMACNCANNTVCYFKELKRLEQENDRLKEEIKEAKKYQYQQEYLDKEIAELKAYKDVNEDFKTAWEELKAENEILKEFLNQYQEEANALKSYETYKVWLNNKYRKENERLKQTLQEIKEIAEQSNVDCIYRISVIRKILTKAEEE